METVVQLRTEVVHRYVFELRYESGYLYWDRAGRIARQIASSEGWELQNIDTNKCMIAVGDTNLGFSFGAAKLDLTQVQSADVPELLPIGEFAAIAERLSTEVTTALELESYPRIGFRTWYLYPARDREDSYRLARSLRLFATDDQLVDQLGAVTETSHKLVVERASHMLRVAVTPFEQQVGLPDSVIQAARAKSQMRSKQQRRAALDKLRAQRIVDAYPHFGLLVDLDAFVEDPPYPDSLSVAEFIDCAATDFEEVKRIALTKSA